MVYFYDLDRIDLGKPSYSGHTVYKKAMYRKSAGFSKKIIYKQNKHADLNFSRFEVGFSAVAGRFLLPDLTPKQVLVKEKSQIVGVASEHYCYAAARRDGASSFCSLWIDNAGNVRFRQFKPDKAEHIPIYFLDQFPSGFFSTLWGKYKKGEIDFDMASLASVLSSSYSLEEDDLHKGNFGFYLVKKRNRVVVVFFKIDNDLMMTDSVMSNYGSRITSWRHGEHAFDITARDLLSFPTLVDSKNHYWPTSRRYLTSPTDSKVYSGFEDIPAFSELSNSKAFRYAKWREFYKHILIPPEVIEQSLMQIFDVNDAKERAQLSVIQHAVIARQAKLRAVLFSVPTFRAFVRRLSTEELRLIRQETLRDMGDESKELSRTITADMNRYDYLCRSRNGFVAGDTPLHVAIRLKDYRYHETWQAFGHFAEVANGKGKKPLDVAVDLAKKSKMHDFTDPGQDPFYTIKALLKEGVEKTGSYNDLARPIKQAIVNYRFGTDYVNRARKAYSSEKLLELMRDIGEDYRYSLKMRKELSISCLKHFIRTQKKNPDYVEILRAIKLALNGNDIQEPLPELQFIRQLRSRLWIVRQIRGLLGGTATQMSLNELIDNQLSHCEPSCCFSFFYSRKEKQTENDISLTQKSGLTPA